MSTGTRIAVFAPVFPPAVRGGGPIRTLVALVDAAPDRFDISVITSNREIGSNHRLEVTPDRWQRYRRGEVRYVNTWSALALLRGLRAARRRRPAALYINGFFHPALAILPQLLHRAGFWRGAPRLVAPRGEFGKAALARRRGRKAVYVAVFRALRLHHGVTWHASSESEARDVRRLWGKQASVIVRANDTLLPQTATAPPARSGEALRLVFVGRFVAHKGLEVALRALGRLRGGRPVDLTIHGFDEDSAYTARCRALAAALPPGVRATFRDPLDPAEVRDTIATFDACLMPTAGENFGHVIAEALSVSCPVLCTPTTPFTDVLDAGGGTIVPDRDPASWADAIDAWRALDDAALAHRRALASAAYDRWRAMPAEPHVLELFDRRVGLSARR